MGQAAWKAGPQTQGKIEALCLLLLTLIMSVSFRSESPLLQSETYTPAHKSEKLNGVHGKVEQLHAQLLLYITNTVIKQRVCIMAATSLYLQQESPCGPPQIET